jgi:hypothetical protein
VQLVDAGIVCGVTVYGTVAHELAYLGVSTIACARHPHHAFGFCRTAHTRIEYVELLRTYATPALSRQDMRRQALAFYYMHNLYDAGDHAVLRDAFVRFWRACNVGSVSKAELMQAFHALVQLPAFDRFVAGMVRNAGSA